MLGLYALKLKTHFSPLFAFFGYLKILGIEIMNFIPTAPFEILSIINTAFLIIIFWLNIRHKRIDENTKNKRELYLKILKCQSCFYDSCESKEGKNEFITILRQCWLYSNDDVIKKGNDFFNTLLADAQKTSEEKQEALQNLVLSIRKDFIKNKTVKTKLSPGDFKIVSS